MRAGCFNLNFRRIRIRRVLKTVRRVELHFYIYIYTYVPDPGSVRVIEIMEAYFPAATEKSIYVVKHRQGAARAQCAPSNTQ